jgi:hypothetical protein
MTTKPLFADSFADFHSVVSQLRDKWRVEDEQEAKKCGDKNFEPSQFWYRGVSRANYELKLKLYRKVGIRRGQKVPKKEIQ